MRSKGHRFGWGAVVMALLALPSGGFAQNRVVGQPSPPPNAIWLDTLDLSKIEQGYGEPHAGRSVDDNPLRLIGQEFAHGIGTHAESLFKIGLKGAALQFSALVGVDDERKTSGSVVFEVWVDGKKMADSGLMRGGDVPKLLTVALEGAKRLSLRVTDGGDGIANDHADWANAYIVPAPNAKEKPEAETVPVTPPRMVMLKPEPRPVIHNPRVVGATPGKPFLFLIPATGDGPLTYSAVSLPEGLTLDSSTGVISGSLKNPGETVVDVTVKGPRGTAKGQLTIVGGEGKLARTPPMGWNSWNVWAGEVDDAKVRAAADWMVKSGLASHGFQYINIDDTWEAGRDANGEIQTNKKFPDMKALSDYVHSKGLKIGIYSSPGPKTCGGYEASYQHEEQDALTYAKWGMDYLKYDWCSYGNIAKDNSLAELQKPYTLMHNALEKTDRDILFSLCQYGMGNVWEWGSQVGGNCWRTTGDINDSWGSLHSIYASQDGHEKFAGPGHWNDPDMLVVGRLGWGNPHPSKLTPNEQLLHISMWCLLSSPLLIGCDMAQLDPFTFALLSNDEALDINQDPLGKPAGRVAKTGDLEVWARELQNGDKAVGLINGEAEDRPITATWFDLGLTNRWRVRDLWMHKDLGTFSDRITLTVPAHGAILLRLQLAK